MNAEFQVIDLEIPAELAGKRLDSALARLLPAHSRTRIKGWIDAGEVQVGRQRCKPSDLVDAGARVNVRIAAATARGAVLPEDIELAVVFEDRDVRVIDKPAGLVVHPGAGNPGHTLQNALLGLDAALAAVPRAGIIHRLDKDTSGLLMVARTPAAHTALTRQLAARTVAREYQAVCTGVMTGGGTISQPIGRHRSDRLRMAVREDGRVAVTHYRVLERFAAHTHVSVRLETGRTHQIRLHMSHSRYPIVGDPVYGGRLTRPRGASAELVAALAGFRRQALHAASLAFDHPRTGKRITLSSPLPPDLRGLLAALRKDLKARGEPD
ncbi:MAG: 23S rRNA pseudouridine(1911/1915/1917) synthase RluD [Steroidobacteraceae bacterium]|jgi:23S rRNA pseudouridine1911/1915/1917 synthase